MNLFFLDNDINLSAQYHVDRHVYKMPIEVMQCMAFCFEDGKSPYKHCKPHKNHPTAVWIRESAENYDYALEYVDALIEEHHFRMGHKHMDREDAYAFYFNNKPLSLPSLGITKQPRCFGEYKGIIAETDDIVVDYRQYYIKAKQHLKKYKNREIPEWFI